MKTLFFTFFCTLLTTLSPVTYAGDDSLVLVYTANTKGVIEPCPI
jgi:hypothetical protein